MNYCPPPINDLAQAEHFRLDASLVKDSAGFTAQLLGGSAKQVITARFIKQYNCEPVLRPIFRY